MHDLYSQFTAICWKSSGDECSGLWNSKWAVSHSPIIPSHMVWRVENSGIGHVVKAGNEGGKAGYCFNLDSVVNLNYLAFIICTCFSLFYIPFIFKTRLWQIFRSEILTLRIFIIIIYSDRDIQPHWGNDNRSEAGGSTRRDGIC